MLPNRCSLLDTFRSPPRPLQRFSIMPKLPPCPDGRFVIDRHDPPDVPLIIRLGSDCHAFLLARPDIPSARRRNLLSKPFLMRTHWNRCYIVPFHMVIILWLRVGNPLHEGKHVGSIARSLQLLNHTVQVRQRFASRQYASKISPTITNFPFITMMMSSKRTAGT